MIIMIINNHLIQLNSDILKTLWVFYFPPGKEYPLKKNFKKYKKIKKKEKGPFARITK